jgi:XTP/dITP diphosphohydrolase
MRGSIIRELRGSGGFGYDVLFVPREQEGRLTSAELAPDEKDRISHRGKALRSIAPTVVDLLRE